MSALPPNPFAKPLPTFSAPQPAPGASPSSSPPPTRRPVSDAFSTMQAQGMVQPGNIDIHHRPRVANPDGSISTVRSASFNLSPELAKKYGLPADTAVLIPTVLWNPDGKTGRIVSAKEAFKHFVDTGENLGFFKTHEDADAYSHALHEQQAQEFNPNPGGPP